MKDSEMPEDFRELAGPVGWLQGMMMTARRAHKEGRTEAYREALALVRKRLGLPNAREAA